MAFWNAKLNRNIQRDQRVLRELREMGWSVLVVWTCETTNVEKLITALGSFLND